MLLSFSELKFRFGEMHPGFDLVAVVPVAIPVHIYKVELTVYEVRDYPLLNEHVIKCVDIGLHSIETISNFLGLSNEFVAEAVAHEAANVGTIAIAPTGKLSLTNLGRSKLDDFTTNESRRVSQNLHVDLVTGQASYFGTIEPTIARLAKHIDFDSEDEFLRSLNPIEKEPKGLDDFSVSVVDALLSDPISTPKARVSVLEVLDAKRTSKKPFFALGQILVFADESATQLMMNMSVDGQRRIDHDRILLREDVQTSLEIEVLPAAAMPEPGQVFTSPQLLTSTRAQQLSEHFATLPVVSDVEVEESSFAPSPAHLRHLRQHVPVLFRDQIEPVRLAVEDHPQLLRDAFSLAKRRILIISPWVKSAVVNNEFIRSVDSTLSRGVQVDFAIGFKEDLLDSHSNAIKKLTDLSKRYPNNFNLHKWKSHEKVLLVDDSYIETSFNWLSFAGVNTNHYRRERGTLTVNKALVDEFYDELIKAVHAERDPNWP